MRSRSLIPHGTFPSPFRRSAVPGALMLGLLIPRPRALAQNQMPGPPPPIVQATGEPQFGDVRNASPDEAEEARRIRILNAERQKALVRDTAKLLKLAGELNAAMTSERSQAPSELDLRRIAEIEKLARSVKEKMSTTLTGPSPNRQGIFPPVP